MNMLKRFVVKKNERALLYAEGDFQAILEPGLYRRFDPRNRLSVELFSLNCPRFEHRLAGYLLNTRTRGKFKQTQKGTNLPFCWDGGPQPLNGYRAAVTNNVPNNLTKGTSTTVCSAALFGSDWSNVVIGTFGAPDVVVDPFTKADTGQVKITLNMFADLAHRQPATTAKIEDLLAN